MAVEIRINSIEEKDISLHLHKVENILEGVEIATYAKKIGRLATTVEAWDENQLIGLCACYMNDVENKCGYITHIAVDKSFQGNGVGKSLLLKTEQLLLERKFSKLSLEVHKQNSRAYCFYCKNGFSIKEDRGDKFLMETEICSPIKE